MTEYDSFSVLNMKNTCRACLRVSQDVVSMTAYELNAYQNFAIKVTDMDWEMKLCMICKWMLRKFMGFTQQCQKANEILSQVVDIDSKAQLFSPLIKVHDYKTITTVEYMGPEVDVARNKGVYALEMDFDDDHFDDDDLPLVMLQDDKMKRDVELIPKEDIKQEFSIQDPSKKPSKKRKKQMKEGFTSRMVQETDEYIVIKLTKEQVLQEMAERSRKDSYLRAPYKCETCIKGFNFEDVLQTHNEKHRMEHGSYLCDICNQYCPSPVSLRGHMKSHTTRYKCKLCDVIRFSRQHLLEHHAITHTSAPTSYACEKCDFTTNKRTIIQRHVRTHAASERHACHKCGKLFGSIETLRVHTIRHDKSKRLQCQHCDKHFIYPSLLHKHVLAVHERKDYYCVECDVRFKSPESLRLHFKKAKRHRDASSYTYPCPQCPQRFVSAASLSVHQSGAHGAAKQHACTVCPRLYSSRDALRAHAWRVHSHVGRRRKNNGKDTMRVQTGDRAAIRAQSIPKTHQKHEDIVPDMLAASTNIPRET